MIKHYFKIAIRNLKRQKVLTGINIFGLSVGLACFSLFLLYAVNEFSFDRFHKNADNIFRVYRWTESIQGEPASSDPHLPMPLGPALKQELPDVQNYVRIKGAWNETYVRVGNNVDKIRVSFADPQLFSMFSFKLESGQPATALKNLHDIVLTEKIARKLFGNAEPVGQTIFIKRGEGFEPFVVSAIAENPPSNSSIQFEAVGHFDYLTKAGEDKRSVNNWMLSAYTTYVQLKEGSKLATDRDALIPFRKKYYPDEEAQARKAGYWTGEGVPVRYALQPMHSIHTDTKIGGSSAVNPKTIWILLGIAFGVLLIACINFTTLAIGRSASRAKEIGLRKVLGGQRKQLIWQFLAEAFLLTMFSVIVGLFLAYLLLPYFNQLSGKELVFSFQQFPELIWMILGLTLLVSVLSGSYPALVLSGFRPLEVLKQKIKLGGSNFLTRSLVTLQFVLSIGLIASTLIILQQLNYMRGSNPGFNKENVVIVNGSDVDGSKVYPLFKQAALKNPGIAGIASSDMGLGEGQGSSSSQFDYKGKLKQVYEYFIDPEYLSILNMKLVRGRNFDPLITSDTATSVIINETMVNEFGWTLENAVGQTLDGYLAAKAPVVIGVVKDFNFQPFSEKIGAQMFHMFNGYTPNKYFVKLKPGDPAKALASLQKAWTTLVPNLPFNYSFLDETLDNFYKSEIRWSRIIGWAAGISIFLACLGLFGLAALAAFNRIKEIGIRKVLGASLSSIIGLLSKDFLKLITLAFLFATPLVWYFMKKWLEGFAFRINMPVWIFFAASGFAVFIALITIGSQAVKAGNISPVKSLRSE